MFVVGEESDILHKRAFSSPDKHNEAYQVLPATTDVSVTKSPGELCQILQEGEKIILENVPIKVHQVWLDTTYVFKKNKNKKKQLSHQTLIFTPLYCTL